ncbi:MAG: HEAT repeat domain-containing protein [Gemmataceae bacterium]
MNSNRTPLSQRKNLLRVLAVIATFVVLTVYVWTTRTLKLSYSLHDPNPAYRAAALRALDPKGNEEAFFGALHDDNLDVRLIAVENLANLGPGAWPTIKKGLVDPNPAVRSCAARAIAVSNRPRKGERPWPSQIADEAALILEGLESDEDASTRHQAKEALIRINRDHQ